MRTLILFSCIPLFFSSALQAEEIMPPPETPAPAVIKARPDTPIKRLATALTYATISTQDPALFPHDAFDAFEIYLEHTFPKMHTQLQKEKHGQHGLLFIWPGNNPKLKPALYMAHQDVVPVPAIELKQWTHPPFSGAIADGYLWGRGAIDVKAMLMALCETVETLLEKNYQPQRTLYFAFGQDEETGGEDGNKKIAAHFKSQGIELAWIHDEGMVITDGVIDGLDEAVALIGVAEKGYMSLELTAPGMGGHSSMPPPQTAVTRLAKALVAISENPLSPSMEGPVKQLFSTLAPHMPFPQNTLFGNLWLFQGLVTSKLADVDTTNALVRTTIAPTMLSGSIKDNVLPTEAKSIINFRIHPNDTVEKVRSHIRDAINDDGIKIEVAANTLFSEPSTVSTTHNPGYELIEKTLKKQFPKIHVAPALFVAATDSRHYRHLTDNIYRFTPFWMRADDRERIHGINERISVKNYDNYVDFFMKCIEAAGQDQTP
jgi:carboxypeptidase PM20D1